MNYDLNEEQTLIREAAKKFFSKECPSQFVRDMAEDDTGYTPAFWQGMAEMGWMGLLVPEAYGGYDASFLDLMVLLAEMGYAAAPGPFFSTVVLGGLPLLTAGSDEQKAAFLPGIASGERLATLAWTEEAGRYTPEAVQVRATADGTAYVLSGAKRFVPDAHVADVMICAARTGDDAQDISLFLVDAKSPGISVSPLITMAGDKQCEVKFDAVNVPGEALLGEINRGWPVLRQVQLTAAVAKCAEMTGGARKAMDLVTPWAKERIQFGRPIGAFQAVQHHCANMLTYLDTLTYMTYQASWLISEGKPFDREAAMCKAYVSDAYRKLVAIAHQVLGGLGFMEEHDLGLYFKRAKAAELFFGDADVHREVVAEEMGL
ncbi:MAG: acyl-CoA/acyl-ACP dehydrogenase [Deltaproteobacteria bacterium]|nr:acyl-CoA/acyl-ACP dehydrogenase [Deltaproteobacteria bacterium]